MVHNANVPFTLAHGAAALPFRRLPLVTSALVVGTFAPDFEYFLRLAPNDRFGHTLLGILVLTLPLALLVLWLFHAFVKRPVVTLLPESIQRRLTNHLDEFRFRGAARFALIVGSILVGIATHLVWDSFTHRDTWLYDRWPFLSQELNVPLLGPIQFYKAFQHGSTIIGLAVLSIWLIVWYRDTAPSGQLLKGSVSWKRKMAAGAVVAIVTTLLATTRAVESTGVPTDRHSATRFVGVAVVTAIALLWWLLVVYGVFWSRNKPSAQTAEQ